MSGTLPHAKDRKKKVKKAKNLVVKGKKKERNFQNYVKSAIIRAPGKEQPSLCFFSEKETYKQSE